LIAGFLMKMPVTSHAARRECSLRALRALLKSQRGDAAKYLLISRPDNEHFVGINQAEAVGCNESPSSEARKKAAKLELTPPTLQLEAWAEMPLQENSSEIRRGQSVVFGGDAKLR
jgi:hypothetical protein